MAQQAFNVFCGGMTAVRILKTNTKSYRIEDMDGTNQRTVAKDRIIFRERTVDADFDAKCEAEERDAKSEL